MHIQPSDPDISTLVSRIEKGAIVLQPDFQRAMVWNVPKQQRLIDSIFRGWHIPPVHLVRIDGGTLEVLDGQQRLTSIYNFASDDFTFNGNLEPVCDDFSELDGLYYSELSDEWKNLFDQFSIRQFVLSDYEPTEPFELFYRLNQSVQLTPAEQRNAFYGKTRDHIHGLTDFAESVGWSKNTIGFDNRRMSYQDIFARSAYALEQESIAVKFGASQLAEWYRDSRGVSNSVVKKLRFCIEAIHREAEKHGGVRLNKASVFSWMLAYSRLASRKNADRDAAAFGEAFEILTNRDLKESSKIYNFAPVAIMNAEAIFRDRSSSRVSDTNSVVLRDAIILGLARSGMLPADLARRSRIIQQILDVPDVSSVESEIIWVYQQNDWDLI